MKFPNPSGLFSKPARPAPVAEAEGMLRTHTPEDVIKSRLQEEGYTADEAGRALDQAKAKVGVLGLEAPMFNSPSQIPPWQTQQGGRPETPFAQQPFQPQQAQQAPQEFPQRMQQFPGEEPGMQQFPSQQQGQQPPAKEGESPWEKPEQVLEEEFAQARPQPPAVQKGAAPWEPQAIAAETPTWSEIPAGGAQIPTEVLQGPEMDKLKDEMELKFAALDEKMDTLLRNGEKLEQILNSIDIIRDKTADISTKTSNVKNLEKDLDELKTNINSILDVLKTTFPPMIRTLKELKEPVKRRREIEHLL